MTRSVGSLFLGFSLIAPVLADTVKIPADKPVASITFPDGWKATSSGDTITARSEEDEVFIDVIITRPGMLGPSNDKAFALLKVKPDFDSFKETKRKINGMNVTEVKVDTKDSSGATMKLILTSFEVTRDKGIMFIIRGPDAEDNADDIKAILSGVAPAPREISQ